jgi:hypothetical protein
MALANRSGQHQASEVHLDFRGRRLRADDLVWPTQRQPEVVQRARSTGAPSDGIALCSHLLGRGGIVRALWSGEGCTFRARIGQDPRAARDEHRGILCEALAGVFDKDDGRASPRSAVTARFEEEISAGNRELDSLTSEAAKNECRPSKQVLGFVFLFYKKTVASTPHSYGISV